MGVKGGQGISSEDESGCAKETVSQRKNYLGAGILSQIHDMWYTKLRSTNSICNCMNVHNTCLVDDTVRNRGLGCQNCINAQQIISRGKKGRQR